MTVDDIRTVKFQLESQYKCLGITCVATTSSISSSSTISIRISSSGNSTTTAAAAAAAAPIGCNNSTRHNNRCPDVGCYLSGDPKACQYATCTSNANNDG